MTYIEDRCIRSIDLELACEILDKEGWIQKAEHRFATPDDPGGFCALGAIKQARWRAGERVTFISEVESLTGTHDFQLAYDGYMAHGLAGFNDTPGRTKEEVQDLLMQAAKKLRDMGR